MINGDANTFIDYLSCGEELYFSYNNKQYFFTAFVDKINDVVFGRISDFENPDAKDVWSFEGEYTKALDSFLHAPIFEGKTFWEAEKEIEWCEEF